MRPASIHHLSLIAVLALTVGTSQPAAAAFVTVGEGGNSLADWGVTLGDAPLNSNTIGTDWAAQGFTNSVSGLSPGTKTLGNGFKFAYVVEDTTDDPQIDSEPLGPNNGGQDYDGEFMGVGRDHNNTVTTADDRLVVAIASGQRLNNDFVNFSPGDVIISALVGSTVSIYAVEVGGMYDGVNGGAFVDPGGSIVETNPGSTFSLEGNGHTAAVMDSNGNSFGSSALPPLVPGTTALAGEIYKNPTLISDPIAGPNSAVQMLITGGTSMGFADFYYSRNAETTQHAVIELAINLDAVFGVGATILSVSWAPACGNDLLVISTPDLLVDAPEPTSMLLTGLGAVGFIGFRRRQKTKVAA
jgi:hypothetical protein